MTSNDYKIYFDCGHSRLRAGAFNKHDANNPFFTESLFFSDQEKILDLAMVDHCYVRNLCTV